MKKLFILRLLVLSVTILFFMGCQKDLTTHKPTASTPEKKDAITRFEDLKANVIVDDGVLTFATPNDYFKTVKFLGAAPKTEISKWTESLQGFTSIFEDYQKAKNELVDNPDKLDELKVRYEGKVLFTAYNEIEPIIDNGSVLGRLVSSKGLYKVGKSIVLFYKDKLISVPDGNLEKLDWAKKHLETDTIRKVYIHNVAINASVSNSIAQRGFCLFNCFDVKTCSNTCPISTRNTEEAVHTDGKRYLLRIVYEFQDYSTVIFSEALGHDFASEFIAIECQVDHKRKRWLDWVGDRQGFNWGIGWNVNLSIPSAVATTTNYTTFNGDAGGTGWFSNEAFFNQSITVWLRFIEDDTGIVNFYDAGNKLEVCVQRIQMVANSVTGVTVKSPYCEH